MAADQKPRFKLRRDPFILGLLWVPANRAAMDLVAPAAGFLTTRERFWAGCYATVNAYRNKAKFEAVTRGS